MWNVLPVYDYPHICVSPMYDTSLLWRHNWHNGVSNHQPHDCLLSHLFKRRSKKTSKLRVTGLCVNSPHKGLVTRKSFPFDDVIIWDDYRNHVIRIHWSYYCAMTDNKYFYVRFVVKTDIIIVKVCYEKHFLFKYFAAICTCMLLSIHANNKDISSWVKLWNWYWR